MVIKKSVFVAFAGLGLILVLVCAGNLQIRKANESAAYSSVISIYSSLQATKANPIKINESFESVWRILTDKEMLSVFATIDHSNIDTTALTTVGIPLDPWGRPLMIAVRHAAMKRPEYIVWSTGADGISGSNDDIVAPKGAKLTAKGLVSPR